MWATLLNIQKSNVVPITCTNHFQFLCAQMLFEFKVINHCIFRDLKAFLYGEEHRMYFYNIPVLMTREKKKRKNIINKLENDLFY